MISHPVDHTWLPPFIPDDVMLWEMHPRRSGGRGFVQVRGTHAVEFVCAPDGRAVEIVASIDGMRTYHWRRDPIDGTWPGYYVWEAVEIRGQGLVSLTLSDTTHMTETTRSVGAEGD